MKKIIFLAAFAAFALVSCNEEIIPTNVPTPEQNLEARIPINISTGVWTKLSSVTGGYADNDAVGIYVVNHDGGTPTFKAAGNYVDNEKFTLVGGSWTPDNNVYWVDDTTLSDLYCYYPYQELTSSLEVAHKVKEDQGTIEAYYASELLYGAKKSVAPTSEVVNIETAHMMSSVVVELVAGSGFDAAAFAALDKSVTFQNVVVDSQLDLTTGTLTAGSTKSAVKTFNIGDGKSFKAILVPQTTVASTVLMLVVVDGVEYKFTPASVYDFKGGVQYTFSITVDKTETGFSLSMKNYEIDSNVNTGHATDKNA